MDCPVFYLFWENKKGTRGREVAKVVLTTGARWARIRSSSDVCLAQERACAACFLAGRRRDLDAHRQWLPDDRCRYGVVDLRTGASPSEVLTHGGIVGVERGVVGGT